MSHHGSIILFVALIYALLGPAVGATLVTGPFWLMSNWWWAPHAVMSPFAALTGVVVGVVFVHYGRISHKWALGAPLLTVFPGWVLYINLLGSYSSDFDWPSLGNLLFAAGLGSASSWVCAILVRRLFRDAVLTPPSVEQDQFPKAKGLDTRIQHWSM